MLLLNVSNLMTQSSKSETAVDYDEWAATYDTVQNRTRDLAATVLQKVDLDLTGRTIAEIGCGTGRNTAWLARPEAEALEIVALDFSEGMLARARERVSDSRVRFVHHDVRTRWPLENASVDVVIVMLVMEHVEDLRPVFREAGRVLRAAGDFLICELHPERQLLGKKAEFTSEKTGALKYVEAFLHQTEDYLNAGELAGFELVRHADWYDEDNDGNEENKAKLPRVLSVHFRSRGSAVV